MPGLLQKPLFRGLFKNQAPISLSLPPSLLPSLLTTPPPVKSWHPASAPFQPEIPEPAAVPWQKRPSAEAWTRSPPKVSHKLRKEERKTTLDTEEPTKATAASGVMKQRQTQALEPWMKWLTSPQPHPSPELCFLCSQYQGHCKSSQALACD
ncbi:uncharacterized protein LOC122686176 [Cervus elaphus]|uniref:uncharacterized protein LOC122686176 n=1 Tax=Cervus elaphus TaxID=9860 RepID=UPI001CC2DCFD|nr:uncharacterized protein LOC122686176 [Cervus elaphus]